MEKRFFGATGDFYAAILQATTSQNWKQGLAAPSSTGLNDTFMCCCHDNERT